MKLFKDRKSAGKLLAVRLKGINADLVLGIPRGGVVVAAEIARSLKLPLDIIVTRKIGAPDQEELALGAADPDGEAVWDEELLKQLKLTIYPGLAPRSGAGNLQFTIKKAKEEIKRREKVYRQGRSPLNVVGKTVILVDDGMATGATTLSAARFLKRHQAKIILAVPVASQSALEKLKDEVEQTVILEIPEYFQAVGQFYHQFEPVTDGKVVQSLDGR